MSTDEMKLAFDVVQTVLFALVAIMNWLGNRQRVTTTTISKLEDNLDRRLDDHANRLTRVEQDLKNAPNHNDLGKIYDEIRSQSKDITAVGKAIEKLSGAFEPLEKLVVRMDEFWRSNGK